MRGLLSHLTSDQRGTAVIETAIVAPVLVLMGIGAFESGMMISRQVELQNAAAEAAQIALSSPPQSVEERTTLKEVIKTSTGLGDADVAIAEKFRCGTDAAYVDSSASCSDTYSTFVQITLTDTYEPIWAQIAFGSSIDYNIVRTVQVG